MKRKVLLVVLLSLISFLVITGCTEKTEQMKLHNEINQGLVNFFRDYYDEDSYTYQDYQIKNLSSEGGTAEVLFKGKNIKSIVLTLYGELGKTETQYFMIDKNMIYIIQKTYEFNTIIYRSPSIEQVHIKEFFIYNSKVMQYDTNKKCIIESFDNANIATQYETVMSEIN